MFHTFNVETVAQSCVGPNTLCTPYLKAPLLKGIDETSFFAVRISLDRLARCRLLGWFIQLGFESAADPHAYTDAYSDRCQSSDGIPYGARTRSRGRHSDQPRDHDSAHGPAGSIELPGRLSPDAGGQCY